MLRASLAASDVWSAAASALADCVSVIKANVASSVANSVTQSNLGDSGDDTDQVEEDDDDGLGYTLRVSKGQLPDVESAADLAGRSMTVHDRVAVEVGVETATSVLRFLRNACAGVRANQDACRAWNILSLVRIVGFPPVAACQY